MRLPAAALACLVVLPLSSHAFLAPRPCPAPRHRPSTRSERAEDTDGPPEPPQFDFSDVARPVVFGERLNIPFSDVSYEFDGLTNDGAFSWMVPYLRLFGYVEGNTVVGGVPQKIEDDGSVGNEEERDALRAAASRDLRNIGDEERARRADVAALAYPVAGLLCALSSLLLDEGDLPGHLFRFLLVFPPLAVARSLQLSAERGLWNVAQAGAWDVSGAGIEPVGDADLAARLLEKVNGLNVEAVVTTAAVAFAFAAIPQDVAARASLAGLAMAALYAAHGKIPTGGD